MQEQSHTELAEQLMKSSAEIDAWLTRARSYVEDNKIALRKEAEAAMDRYQALIDRQDYSQIASIRMDMAAQEVIDNSIINDGYRILNEIGESIRGQKITYSITVTSTGHWGSADGPAGEVITWEMDYSAFSKLLHTGTKRITLKDSSTIMSQLEEMWKQQQKNQTLNQFNLFSRKEWSTKEISQYESFHSWAKRYRKDRGKRIFYNRGQTLEGYLRWISETAKGIKYTRDMSMIETAANNLPFYAGGDIGDIQVKGMNASVANIDTMISVLVDTQEQLYVILSESQRMAADVSKVDAKAINDNIDKAIQSLLVKYGFKPG